MIFFLLIYFHILKMNANEVNTNTNNENTKYLSQEIKRKKLIEKIAITLKLQHNKLFTENKYFVKNLISDLKEIIRLDDIYFTSFETFYSKVEQMILRKFTKNEKQFSKSSDFSHTLSLIPKSNRNFMDNKMSTIGK